MKEREGRVGGVKGTSLAGMHISSGRHAYAWGWSKAPIKRRRGVDQMEREKRKGGGDRTQTLGTKVLCEKSEEGGEGIANGRVRKRMHAKRYETTE